MDKKNKVAIYLTSTSASYFVFGIGCSPIGIRGIKPGDVRYDYQAHRLAATPQASLDATVSIHIGDVITRVYEPILAQNEN